MTTATGTKYRPDLDGQQYQALSPTSTVNDSEIFAQNWDEGLDDAEDSPVKAGATRSDERVKLINHVESEDISLIDIEDKDAAYDAAQQMRLPAAASVQDNSTNYKKVEVLDIPIERSHLHCASAASVGLIFLSIASFVLPSISTYPPERSAVQALGYSAGVVSLLSGLAAGAFVVYAHAKSSILR
jgi:hypothetical protein